MHTPIKKHNAFPQPPRSKRLFGSKSDAITVEASEHVQTTLPPHLEKKSLPEADAIQSDPSEHVQSAPPPRPPDQRTNSLPPQLMEEEASVEGGTIYFL